MLSTTATPTADILNFTQTFGGNIGPLFLIVCFVTGVISYVNSRNPFLFIIPIFSMGAIPLFFDCQNLFKFVLYTCLAFAGVLLLIIVLYGWLHLRDIRISKLADNAKFVDESVEHRLHLDCILAKKLFDSGIMKRHIFQRYYEESNKPDQQDLKIKKTQEIDMTNLLTLNPGIDRALFDFGIIRSLASYP